MKPTTLTPAQTIQAAKARAGWNVRLAEDASLVVRLGEDPLCLLRVLPWSLGMGWAMANEEPRAGAIDRVAWAWKHHDHRLDLLNPLFALRRDTGPRDLAVLSEFTGSVPEEIRGALRRYHYLQGTMLFLTASYPAAADLALGNPNLLWLLALARERREFGDEEMPYLLSERQHLLLGRLIGQECRKSAARLLRRVDVSGGQGELLDSLRELVQAEHTHKWLAHWPSIPQRALGHVLDADSPVFARCLGRHLLATEASQHDREIADTARLWQDLMCQRDDLGDTRQCDAAIARLSSVEALERLHERWTARIARQEAEVALRELEGGDWSKCFPVQPLSDDPSVRPLTTAGAMLSETFELEHCVYSRRGEAWACHACYFAVYEPERATLEVSRLDGVWTITEFRLFANLEPSAESWRHVEGWLARHREALEAAWQEGDPWKQAGGEEGMELWDEGL